MASLRELCRETGAGRIVFHGRYEPAARTQEEQVLAAFPPHATDGPRAERHASAYVFRLRIPKTAQRVGCAIPAAQRVGKTVVTPQLLHGLPTVRYLDIEIVVLTSRHHDNSSGESVRRSSSSNAARSRRAWWKRLWGSR